MSYSSTILAESSLSSYWQLDESSGSALDSKGANDLSLLNSPTQGQGNAINGTCYLFVSGSYGNKTTPTSLPTTGSYSLEGWVRVSTGTTLSTSTALGIIGYGNPGTNFSCNVLDIIDPIILRNWWYANDCSWHLNNDCTDGLWHHYVVTYDGTTSKAYQDGVQLSLISGSATRTSNNFSLNNLGIGVSPSNAAFPAGNQNKYIDEVAIYNAALTLSQIQDHYNAAPPKIPTYLIPRRRRIL